MIGNYGVPSESEVDEHGISVHFESSKIHVGALLIDDLTPDYRFGPQIFEIFEFSFLTFLMMLDPLQPLCSSHVIVRLDEEIQHSRYLRDRYPNADQEASHQWQHARQSRHGGTFSF
jgi:hypothetical protein